MKRWYFAVALLLSIVIIIGIGIFSVNNSSKQMLNAFDEIEISLKQDNKIRAVELCEKAEKKWVENEKKLTYFVNHSEMCEIGVDIASMKALLKNAEIGEFYSALESARVKLSHLAAMEKIK
ncbi:MAG: DUF4363 family protein [Clostridia bacterium]|nr:DUF4363 family protein [Clostridia bacterium]